MGDADDNIQPSKKRAAGVQLSRDDPDLDDNEETSDQETGTFKRASDEVLATRRIVKVRRQQLSTPSAPSPASNPFASIHLVPPASAPTVESDAAGVTTMGSEQVDKNDSKSGNVVDEPNDESTAGAKPSENKAESVNGEVAEGENAENGVKKATEADGSEKEATKEVESKGNDEEKGNGEVTTEKNAQTTSFSSFQQLSSGQNAFSGLSGTGFSSTSFSFGSTPIFGTSGANLASKSEGPSMQEVPVETGEENEKAVFMSNSVLFEFIDGAWKERGKGELKINVSTDGTRKARLIMRARGNYRLILNANLFPDMKLTNMDKKGITFACVNSASEGKDGLSTIALKFKDASIVEEFRAAVMEHKSKTAIALKTPENSP
ncbi:hypothetical protein CDL12_29545 [Handroanthus impetiginosus]|uniref:RanBD1 domain-containing protein n=1 Tax=Handroanthus impetiginosus TaxID=429701 RepID=A0A2G9FZ98_9LAMI|nr:hypothetical protein CDL12_29545 [Handroanthus impetiginosus]